METLIGLVMIYAWVHSVVLGFKYMKETTTYEKVVLLAGLVGFVLYVVGTLS